MADERKPMSQDEIDSLLAGLTGDAPVSPPATPPAPAKAAGADAALAQDALDALLAEVASPTPPKAAVPPPAAQPMADLALDQNAIDTLLAAAPQPSKPVTKSIARSNAKPATANLALDQDAIDALLAAAAEPPAAAKTPPPKPAAPKPAAAPTGPLDQDAIDALIAGIANEPSAARPSTEIHQPGSLAPVAGIPLTRRTGKDPAPAPTGALDQDAIDALIAATSEEPARDTTTARASEAPSTGQPLTRNQGRQPDTDIERLLASVETSAQERAKATVGALPGVVPGVPLDQDDIDKLLAELGASAAPSPAGGQAPVSSPSRTGRGAVPSGATGSLSRVGSTSKSGSSSKAALALSSDDLDALMNKHNTGDTEAGVDMIDQGDIDALVKQLAAATDEPNKDAISEALAKHGDAIDKLLEKGVDPHLTQDAVEMPKNLTLPASADQHAHPATVVAQLPPIDMRGTRWLLAAAVVLLAACAAILAMVVGAVGGLSRELRQERIAQLTPSDDFHDDFSAARAKLSAPDEAEASKGVLFLERLQKRYPEHEADIALVLARYHRSIGAIARAVRDYAVVVESSNRPLDDPRIYLEYAECLFQQEDEVGSTRQVYVVLANEALYRSERDHRGVLRPNEERDRNRRAVQDAYLALGRMLASSVRNGGRVAAKGHERSSHGESEHSASGHSESGHGASTKHGSGAEHAASEGHASGAVHGEGDASHAETETHESAGSHGKSEVHGSANTHASNGDHAVSNAHGVDAQADVHGTATGGAHGVVPAAHGASSHAPDHVPTQSAETEPDATAPAHVPSPTSHGTAGGH